MSNFLDIGELRRAKQKKDERKNEIYTNILKSCHNSIIRANYKKEECFYRVPAVKFDAPSYKLNDCVAFLVFNLTQNGFSVKFIKPNYLYINWSSENSLKKSKKLYNEPSIKDTFIDDFIPINSKANKSNNYFRDLANLGNTNIYDDDLVNSFANMTSKLS